MLRTGLLSASLAVLGYLAAAWVTEDFQVWTAEGARRLEVIERPTRAPTIRMLVPSDPSGTLLPALFVDNAGEATVVDFIYTRCPSVCSALGTEFQQLQKAILADPQHRVRLLSVSFDPTHDNAQTLAQYAARVRADPQVWRFATPADARDLAQLLAAYQVVVIPDGMRGYEHNAALLVVDARGRLVRVFDYSELELALAYARSISGGGG
jgi:protein SCO1